MSNFDDEKRQIEDALSNNLTDTSKNIAKTGGKIAYKGAKKIGTSAGRKMLKRGFLKKTGTVTAKGVRVVGAGLMNIGKFIIIGLKFFLATLLSWAWLIIPICLIITIIWLLMPATRHFTLEGINKDATSGDTTMILSEENRALENYFTFYSDRVLNSNKIKIDYKGIDKNSSGSVLFDELNDKEYIVGPFKPNKIVQPKQTSTPSTGGFEDGSESSNGTQQPNKSDYTIPKIENIIKVEWFKGGEKVLKVPKLNGDKLTAKQIEEYKFLVYDITSGKTFYMVRTMGSNHNDVEYASENDALIMKNALEKEGPDYNNTSRFDNWTVRPVFVIQGNEAIIATWTTRNHAGVDSAPGLKNVANRSWGYGYGANLDYISNGQDGHMDLYFHGAKGHANPNSTYHKKPLENLEKAVSNNKQKYLDLLNSNNGTNNESRSSKQNIEPKKSTTTSTPMSSTSSSTSSTNIDNSKITIMIDPGHGGTDSGAVGYVVEKDINLKVSLMVRANLQALGYKVIMSRETDKTLNYGTDRTQLSNNYADVCISIHCNSGGSGSARGIETFYPTSGANKLATYIQNQVISETKATNRGVKPASATARGKIGILDNNKKPVALIELGFVNNKSDADLLKDSSYQEKLTKGIVNGFQNYFNNTPIDELINSGSTGGTPETGDIYNVVDEMEGFISTSKSDITDKQKIKEETIDKMQSYWINKAKPTLAWTWSSTDDKNDLNKIINDSYSIKPFEEIDKSDKEYKFDIDEEEGKKIKDKYGREEYFKMTPELLHSLNQSLYKDDFIHSESLIKPVKVNEDKLELDYNAFNPQTGLSESKKVEYGLGTVFVYRPLITFKIKKGIEINQTEVAVEYEEGMKYESKPIGTVIYNYDAKLEYVLERAITFTGEYIFSYEEEINLVDEEYVEDINYNSSKGIATGRLVQSKTYEVTEVPKDIKFNDKGRSYIYNYLGTFNTKIPEEIINRFNKQRLYDAFRYYENVEDNLTDGEDETTNSDSSGGSGGGNQKIEQWRPLAEEYGGKYGLDPDLILSIIYNESKGDLYIYDGKSNKNSWGLAQIINYESSQHNLNQSGYGAYFNNKDKLDSSHPAYTSEKLPGLVINHLNSQADDRTPNCSGGHSYTECNECERVARLNIEYIAQRLSAQLTMFFYDNANLKSTNASDREKIKEHINNKTNIAKDAFYFTICGYNQGEYGQRKLYRKHGSDLYSSWENYKRYFLAAGAGGTSEYLKKALEDYKMLTGRELITSLDTTDKNGNKSYNPDLWYPHVSIKGGGSGGGSGSEDSKDSLEKNESEASKYDMTLALNYAEYEKTGWFKNDDRYTVVLDEHQIELMLATATAMKEEITVSEVEDGDYAFWDRNFLTANFKDGIPKNRTLKEYRNSVFSEKNWKRITEIVDYLKKHEGEAYVQNIEPFNSSNLIGHAYKIHAGVSLPRTAKGIGDKVENKVEEENITLGDILILRPINSHDSEFDILYPTETAICVGENSFIMIKRKRVMSYTRDMINQDFDTLEIVRPLPSKSVKGNSSSISTNPGLENGTNPHPKGTWIWPVDNPTLPTGGKAYGWRTHPVYGTKKFHTGIDLAKTKTVPGDNIYASRDGVVESVVTNIPGYKNNSYGNQVLLKHEDGTFSRYTHLAYKMIYVKKGDVVKQGDVIGGMGSTGTSTGIHLHFEILDTNGKHQDPMNYLTKPNS